MRAVVSVGKKPMVATRSPRSAARDGHLLGYQPDPARRAWLRGLLVMLAALSSPLTVGSALAKGGSDKGPLNHFKLPTLTLPGRDRLSYVRLEVALVVHEGDELAADLELITALRNRIIGRLNEQLSQERFQTTELKSTQVQALKLRIKEIVNTALEKPVVEDVLIVSLLLT